MSNSRETFLKFLTLLKFKVLKTDSFLKSPSIWVVTTLEPLLWIPLRVLLEDKKSQTLDSQFKFPSDQRLLEEL